jgi:hypothetical protein
MKSQKCYGAAYLGNDATLFKTFVVVIELVLTPTFSFNCELFCETNKVNYHW